jgi:hypothetical protein
VDRIPEFVDNLHETINLSKAHFPLRRVSQTEFKHDPSIAVGYNQDVVSQQISTLIAGVCYCLNEASRPQIVRNPQGPRIQSNRNGESSRSEGRLTETGSDIAHDARELAFTRYCESTPTIVREYIDSELRLFAESRQ